MQKIVFRACAIGLLLAFGLLGLISVCQAETWELKFMPDIPKPNKADGKKYPSPYYFRGNSQGTSTDFNSQSKPVDPAKDPRLKEFREIVTKEPTYVSKHPVKGVVQFGDKRFAFAIDTETKKEVEEKAEVKTDEKADEKSDEKTDDKEEKKKELTEAEKRQAERKKQMEEMKQSMYSRLYIDANGNGDLTDDEPVERFSIGVYPPNYGNVVFKVTLPIEKNGEKFEIPCTLEASINTWSSTYKTPDGEEKTMEQRHIYTSFYTNCFREGEIKLGDKAFRIILIDYNNNGVFNDPPKTQDVNLYQGQGKPSRKETRVTLGDVLYLFPADTKGRPNFAYAFRPGSKKEINPLSVGSIIGELDGQFWNLELTASGDKLTLTPSTEKIGYVEKPGQTFTLQAFNKDLKTYMTLTSDESGKAPLPVGEWIMTGYSMTFKKEKPEEPKEEKTEEPKEGKTEVKKDEKKAEQEKVARAVAKVLLGNRKKAEASIADATEATVIAQLSGTGDSVIKVTDGGTTELKFGEPYQAVVSSNVYSQEKGKYMARLSVDLIGAAGESCSDFQLNNMRRPPQPTFEITTKDGKKVESGAFDYG